MIHLATASDQAYAPGLYVTVASALRALAVAEEVTFHILDGGLAPDSIKQLRLLAAKYHPGAILIFHQIDQLKFTTWRPGPNNSMMAYSRLLLGTLVEASKVIYLDADLIVFSDLKELWNIPMNGMFALACSDEKILKLSDDSPWSLAPGEEKLSYFNSGMMVFDLDQWRLQKMEEQILALITATTVSYRFHDQTILNYLLKHRMKLLPLEWNWQGKITSMDEAAAVNIIHFITGKKPWFWWGGDLRFRLWRSFYKACIGSPLKLFFNTSVLKGLFFGSFEIAIGRHPWLRTIYVRWLMILAACKKNDSSVQITKHYYTEGLGGRSGDIEFKKNQPALKILQWKIGLE